MTLRERLMDLANSQDAYGYEHPTREHVALAAARLALEDAAQECEGNAPEGAGSWSHGYTHAVDNCAAAIRALRDGIA